MARADSQNNNEITLMRLYLEKRVGIYDCDEQIVYSDQVAWLSAGPTYLRGQSSSQILIETHKVDANLSDALIGGEEGARKAAWLNAGDYVKCWKQVVMDGRYRWHDWTVKVDPDTVFFPGRLRAHLMNVPSAGTCSVFLRTCKTTPKKCTNVVTISRSYGDPWIIKVIAASTDTYAVSASCDSNTTRGATCKKQGWGDGVHVVVNQLNQRIAEGNCCQEVNEVKSVTHECVQEQSDSQEPGMSGALEVISKEAITAYSKNDHRCTADDSLNLGEEYFMQECLKLLGAEGVPGEHLLADTWCGGVPGDCRGPEVAFHPFKMPEEAVTCMSHAFEEFTVSELHADLLRVSHADG